MIKIKHYSQKARLYYSAVNILLIVISIILYIAYTIIKGNSGTEEARTMCIVFICSVCLFFLVNIVKIYLEYSIKNSVARNLEKICS